MATTYEPIATTTLGSGSSSVLVMSSIPATYTDLVLISNFETNTGGVCSLFLTFNSDTGSNYSYTRIFGDGSSAQSTNSTTSSYFPGIGIIDASARNANIAQIMNYANTTTHKTTLTRTNSSGTYLGAYVMKWASTSAITSITMSISNGSSFSTGSTFTLYGIKAA